MSPWERLAPLIESALPYGLGSHTLADVEAAVREGSMQFWPGEQAVMLTEIHDFPQKRACHVFLAAAEKGVGNVALPPLVEQVERWAVKQGCVEMTLAGRPGWERSFIRPLGYAPTHILMTKRLANG